MSVFCLNVCRLCMPNIMSLGVCFLKNCTSSKLARSLDKALTFALFSVSGLKDEKLIRKQTYMKTEIYKLYSILESSEYFCQMSSKVDLHNFELYRFKVGAFFSETQCTLVKLRSLHGLFSV